VSDRRVDAGNLIQGGQTGATLLTTIVTLDPIHFVFDASEADYIHYARLSALGQRPSSRDVKNPVTVRLADENEWKHAGYGLCRQPAQRPAGIANIGETQQEADMIETFACRLCGDLFIFAQEGRQFELTQMMGEQNLRRRRAGNRSRRRHAAIVAGSGAAALSFRLLPPLSPAFRARRLLALTLHDLRRLATGPIPRAPVDREGRMYGRLAALPDAAEPLQRSQLLGALAVGSEIIQLRRLASSLGLGPDLDAALEALARGNNAIATARACPHARASGDEHHGGR
jgi:Fusaric acid resistance protein family